MKYLRREGKHKLGTDAKKSKGESTRTLILETALRLFRERGFEATTMRLIAEEAGVALGNAYYYFKSKDELVHAFYARTQVEQFAACIGPLSTERSLKGRLVGTIRALLIVVAPYHKLFGSLFKIAADPESNLNPFSAETTTLREACIDQFRSVLTGADERIPDDLAAELPLLLWMYYMGLILFWIYDRSPGFARTHKLLDVSSDIITQLINLASMPLMVPMRQMILKAIASVREV